MNNMHIVGDVHYYVIRTNDPSHNPLASSKLTGPGTTLKIVTLPKITVSATERSIFSAPAIMELDQEEQLMYIKGGMRRSSLDMPVHSNNSTSMMASKFYNSKDDTFLCGVVTNETDRPSSVAEWKKWAQEFPSIQSTSVTTVAAKEAESSEMSPLVFTAQYYATDDDYLMRRYIREYFKQNVCEQIVSV
jgi:hypothetical protein